jgi:Family of unknown function (DUF6345)
MQFCALAHADWKVRSTCRGLGAYSSDRTFFVSGAHSHSTSKFAASDAGRDHFWLPQRGSIMKRRTTPAHTPTQLPVYRVATTGILETEAHQLADALKIPAKRLRWLDGEALFVDPDKYLAIPSAAIKDPDIVGRFTGATTNHHPEIPIAVTGIDYAALDRHVPFADGLALRSAAAALASAGLTPASARPTVGHTVFTTVAIGADGTEQKQRRTLLDTHVSYRFTVDGYPLVGPGAQVQISYAAEGDVTRLIHATRVIEPGPSVAIIDADAIRERIASSVTDDVEVDVRLVYLAPSLRNALNGSSHWRPSDIIPWYAVTVRRMVKHPDRGEHPLTSRVRLIPATDDTRFVPSVTVAATAIDGSRVGARATVSGGTAPYSFLWGGSNPNTSTERGAAVSYEPLTRDLREIIPAHSLRRTEHISVTVVDANGVSAEADTSLLVTALPAPDTHNSVTYGCESPNDPGAWTGDRVAWQSAMTAFGGGSERFCWLADSSWPGDYIEPRAPGTLGPNPWINGDADYRNWGINTANIVFYIGDANPYLFAEMYPGATPAQYNGSGGAYVLAPNSSTTVEIGSQNYNVPYAGSWGAPYPNDKLQWLPMYACNLLENDANASSPWLSWGQAFNGLHSVLAFDTEAADSNAFVSDFVVGFLGLPIFSEPLTIVQSWLNAANATDIGTPAAMGPIFNIDVAGITLGISDYADHYWGKGAVGPTIPKKIINGWWYIMG